MSQYQDPQDQWFNKDRSETVSNRMSQRSAGQGITVSNPGLGLNIYHNVFSKEDAQRYIDTLESNLDGTKRYKWSEAQVTNSSTPIKKARDCVDFKYKKENIIHDKSEEGLALQQLWQDVYDAQFPAVEDYRKDYRIMDLKYWEAFNFIKYGPGQHFQEHHDHGFSYNCTVSLVAYPNDDYDGGELNFRLQNLNIKPKAGDLFIFPSNYMYPHRAMPVHSGTKYSIVTMLDYNKKFHTPEMYVADED